VGGSQNPLKDPVPQGTLKFTTVLPDGLYEFRYMWVEFVCLFLFREPSMACSYTRALWGKHVILLHTEGDQLVLGSEKLLHVSEVRIGCLTYR